VAELALLLWLLYFVLSLGLRALVQWRRTGSTGLLMMRVRPGSPQWLAEAAQAIAIALGVLAPALADTVPPLDALDGWFAHVAGILTFAFGLAGVVVSQEAMGRSWRIGQDAAERTELVTHGPFAVVRNPIFTALVLAQAGLALLVPSVIALAGLALLLVSIEAQVRLVEEPHLRKLHGDDYTAYAQKVGRFVPAVGRLGRTKTT
jgi:protein-S-isoprenylcysteine O-methyltransferase Ste14